MLPVCCFQLSRFLWIPEIWRGPLSSGSWCTDGSRGMEAADDLAVCPARCTRRVRLWKQNRKQMERPFRHGSGLVPEEELGTQQAIKTISEKELTDSSGSAPPSVWPHSDKILTAWETNGLQRHGLSFTYHWKCWTGWPGVTAGSWRHLNLFRSALGYIFACGLCE